MPIEKQELPPFIQGLATQKSETKQRREIVEKEYANLLDRLAKRKRKKQKVRSQRVSKCRCVVCDARRWS